MIRMKAIASFKGEPTEGKNGRVKMGREFEARSERRAQDLEENGLAHRVASAKAEPPLKNKIEPPLANKTAADGPFDSAGGATGEATPAPSSPQGRPPRRRGSTRSQDDFLS
jgi:hypothetical protein